LTLHRVVPKQRTGQQNEGSVPQQGGGVRKLERAIKTARLVFEVADPNRKVSVPRPATG
jgi:hypothetical protein